MEEKDYESEFISISDILYGLKKRWKIVLITTVLFLVSATTYFCFLSQPTYEGSVKIFVGNNKDIESDYSDVEMKSYYNMMDTYITIIKSDDFMNKIINKTDVNETTKSLMKSVEFITVQNTPILEIKYASKNAQMAGAVISGITREFEDKVTEVVLNTYTKVIDTVKVKDISPNKISMILLATIIGALAGTGLAILIDLLDDTIVRAEDLEKICSIPLLGELPHEATIANNKSKEDKSNKNDKNTTEKVAEGNNVYS